MDYVDMVLRWLQSLNEGKWSSRHVSLIQLVLDPWSLEGLEPPEEQELLLRASSRIDKDFLSLESQTSELSLTSFRPCCSLERARGRRWDSGQ